jgi:hypothetical protein
MVGDMSAEAAAVAPEKWGKNRLKANGGANSDGESIGVAFQGGLRGKHLLPVSPLQEGSLEALSRGRT